MVLRPDEPPLGRLSPAEQNWLAATVKCLLQIDEYRKGDTVNESGHCIFEIGSAYIQCRAPNYAKHLICEAVSGKLVPEIAAILTPEKKDRLVHEFGFIAPGRSPNFAQRIEIKSDADLAYAARLAYRVFRDIYGVKDFAVAKFKVWPPKPVALSVPESEKPNTSNFIDKDSQEVTILRLAAEGGSLDLVGYKDHAGWRFQVRTDESALMDLLTEGTPLDYRRRRRVHGSARGTKH